MRSKRQSDPEPVCTSLMEVLAHFVTNGTLYYVEKGTNYSLNVNMSVGSLYLDPFLEEVLEAETDGGGTPLGIKTITCFGNEDRMDVLLDLNTFLLVPEIIDLYNATVVGVVDLQQNGSSSLRYMMIEGYQILAEVEMKLRVVQGDPLWTITGLEVPSEISIDTLLTHFNFTAGQSNYSFDDVLSYMQDLTISSVSLDGAYQFDQGKLILRFTGNMDLVQLEGETYTTSREVQFFMYSISGENDRPYPYIRVPFSVVDPGPSLHQLTNVASNETAGDEFAANFTYVRDAFLGVTRELIISLQPAVDNEMLPPDISLVGLESLISFNPGDYPPGVYAVFEATFEASVSKVSGHLTDKNVSFSIKGEPVLVRDGLASVGAGGSSRDAILAAHDDFYERNFRAVDTLDSFVFDYRNERMIYTRSASVHYSYFKNHTEFVTTMISFYVDLTTKELTSGATAEVTVGGQMFEGNVTYHDGIFTVYGCYNNTGKDAADGFTVNIPSQGIEAYTEIDAMEMFAYTLNDDQISKTMGILDSVNLYPFNMSRLCFVWDLSGPRDSPTTMRAVATSAWPRKITEDEDTQGSNMTTTALYTLVDGDVVRFTTVLAFEVPGIYLPLFLEQIAGINTTNTSNTLILQTSPSGFVIDIDDLGTLDKVKALSSFFSQLSLSSKFSLGFGFHWPELCNLDRYCEVLRAIYGNDTRFFFTGDVTAPNSTNELSEGYILLKAPADPIYLDSTNVLYLKSDVILEFGDNTSQITLDPILCLQSLGVCFVGSIALTENYDVDMAVKSEDCWEFPFGYRWLKACNLSVDMKIDTDSIPLDSLGMMSGRMDYGFSQCSVLPLVAFLGINFTDNSSSYLVGSLADYIGLPDFLDTLCYTGDNVPALRNAKIMDLEVSYSEIPHSFSTLDFETQEIPVGLKKSGIVEVFGQEGDANFTLDDEQDPQKLTVEVALSILNLHDSSFVMRPKKGSGLTGPKFVADIPLKNNLIPRMWIEGEMEVLGTTQETSVRITSSALQVYLRGFLFEEYDATVIIFGQYAGTLDTVTFKVLGHFNDALLNRLTTAVVDNIVELGRGAAMELSNARDAVTMANETYYFALNSSSVAVGRLEEAKNNYTSELAKLNALKADQINACSNQTCELGEGIMTVYIIFLLVTSPTLLPLPPCYLSLLVTSPSLLPLPPCYLSLLVTSPSLLPLPPCYLSLLVTSPSLLLPLPPCYLSLLVTSPSLLPLPPCCYLSLLVTSPTLLLP